MKKIRLQYCICSKCGYMTTSINKDCTTLNCKRCYSPLVKKDLATQNLPRVDKLHCTGCGKCSLVCMTDAIAIMDKKASINPSLCMGCRLCVNICPLNAIS